MTRYIGKETSRVDGVAKVTGKAKNAAEFRVPNVAYGFIVTGTIAKGRITGMDTRDAERAPGVIRVLTHRNAPRLGPKASTEQSPPRATEERDKSFRALQSDRIVFNAQPVALVVAETYEQARYAARLVKVSFQAEKHETDTEAVRGRARRRAAAASGAAATSPAPPPCRSRGAPPGTSPSPGARRTAPARTSRPPRARGAAG